MNTRRPSLPPPPPPLPSQSPPPPPPPPPRYRRHCRGRRRCGTHLVNGRRTFETDRQKIKYLFLAAAHTHTHTRVNNIVHVRKRRVFTRLQYIPILLICYKSVNMEVLHIRFTRIKYNLYDSIILYNILRVYTQNTILLLLKKKKKSSYNLQHLIYLKLLNSYCCEYTINAPPSVPIRRL